jgi:hypothetical protein
VRQDGGDLGLETRSELLDEVVPTGEVLVSLGDFAPYRRSMARFVVRVRICHDIASSRPVFTAAEPSIDIILKAEIDRIRMIDHFQGER